MRRCCFCRYRNHRAQLCHRTRLEGRTGHLAHLVRPAESQMGRIPRQGAKGEWTMKRLLLSLAAMLLLAAPTQAGITLQQIPSQGAAAYVQLPDGTFLPMKGDANANQGAAAIPTGTFTPVT